MNTKFKDDNNFLFIEKLKREYMFNMDGKHLHSYFEIYYLVSGERNYFIEGREYHIKKGTIVFIDSNQFHRTTTTPNSSHERILIQLNKSLFSHEISQLDKLSIPDFFSTYSGAITFNDKQQQHIEALLNSMLFENENKNPGYKTIILAKISELLIAALRVLLTNNTNQRPDWVQSTKHIKVQEVVEYIKNNYASNINLDELAENVYISKYYLSRIFKEITGLTITEYINFTRIQHAKKLLEESNLSITKIADIIGFNNISYFQKVFKSFVSTTPLKYRNYFIDSANSTGEYSLYT